MTSVRWKVSDGPVAYRCAVRSMEETAAGIRAGEAPETVWLLEHPSLFTAGTSARDDELVDAGDIPVYRTGRGGRYTWHGPGQQIAYVMLDLARRGHDLHAFVADLEAWIIRTLERFRCDRSMPQGSCRGLGGHDELVKVAGTTHETLADHDLDPFCRGFTHGRRVAWLTPLVHSEGA